MLAPLVRRLQNLWVPRGLAVVSVVLLAFGAIFALGTVMARQVTHLARDLPQHEAAITAKIQLLDVSQTETANRGNGRTDENDRSAQCRCQYRKSPWAHHSVASLLSFGVTTKHPTGLIFRIKK